VTVYLRPSASLDWVDKQASAPPTQRRTLSREELARSYGASAEDIAAVRSFAREHGLAVSGVDPGRRSVSLRGTVSAIAKAFDAGPGWDPRTGLGSPNGTALLRALGG
jgi:subtilase family serine protease